MVIIISDANSDFSFNIHTCQKLHTKTFLQRDVNTFCKSVIVLHDQILHLFSVLRHQSVESRTRFAFNTTKKLLLFFCNCRLEMYGQQKSGKHLLEVI